MERHRDSLLRDILNIEAGRRTMLKSSLLGGGAVIVSGLFDGIITNTVAATETLSRYETPVVETTNGKIRGVVRNGVEIFRGIPYGASTAAPNRFMPARKPEPWSGVRDAFQSGYSSPQNLPAFLQIEANYRDNALQGEDCLSLNVFTPGSNGRKRPVMVWIHGGAYIWGSATARAFDGTNLARSGDVVVVTINHRLNIFGYLYLAEVGDETYADSGNIGQLDIVESLRWVRDNIAQFGGDPGNVTIFGQSGGGGKVATLMAMPAAKGLFHKAIIESAGGPLKGISRADAGKSTERVLARLGLQANQIDELQRLPVERLLAAIDANAAGGGGVRLGPVVDGHSLPRDPFEPTAPETSADVPMLIGTVNTEDTVLGNPAPELFTLDEAGMRERLNKILKGSADEVIETFRKDRPGANPTDLYFYIMAWRSHRMGAITAAERKSALGKAPTYMYLFTWQTPVQGGKFRSPHTIELPFAFNNVLEAPEEVGTGPELQPLADKVSGAWTAFARTGNPSVAGTPKWPSYSADDRSTMIINSEWEVVNDPHKEERLAMEHLRTEGSE